MLKLPRAVRYWLCPELKGLEATLVTLQQRVTTLEGLEKQLNRLERRAATMNNSLEAVEYTIRNIDFEALERLEPDDLESRVNDLEGLEERLEELETLFEDFDHDDLKEKLEELVNQDAQR